MNPGSKTLSDLAAFQAALLEVLAAGGPLPEMRGRLERAAETCGLGDYARSFDDRMIVVASELVRKWGRKDMQG